MTAFDFLRQPVCQRVGLSLAHFLWQGMLVAVVAHSMISLTLRRPAGRYAGYLLALLVAAACPVVTFLAVEPSVAEPPVVVQPKPVVVSHYRPLMAVAARAFGAAGPPGRPDGAAAKGGSSAR